MNSLKWDVNAMPRVRTAGWIKAVLPVAHPDRMLDYTVLLFVVCGALHIAEGDAGEITILPGHAIFLRPNIRHYGKTFCAPNTCFYYVHFYLPQPESDFKLFNYSHAPFRNQEFEKEDFKTYLKFPREINVTNAEKLADHFEVLRALFVQLNPMAITTINQRMYALLLHLYEQCHNSQPAVQTNRIVHKLLIYLDRHRYSIVSSDTIEEYMQMNYKYLCGLFKKNMGYTIREYCTKSKMNEAAHLLRDTTLSIAQIAEQLGYTDPFYFSKVFKKHKQTSPALYRKRYP